MSSMSATHVVLACLISALPGPPGVRYEDAYIQLFPIDKTKCPTIDPVRDIAYQLYTRNNPLQADVLRIGDDDALAHSHMNFSDPTVIFFHAFFESSTGTTAWTIKTAYLQRKQHNIILLNAPRLEAGPWYFTAARNTRVVGEYTANFVDYLVSRGMPLESLHLVGLSLGAQMAGITGSNVRSGRVPRITGLDPAGPVFTKLPNSLKLDKSDAEFVDIIHSDAGIFGYPRAIGHVDFWPNKGISPQPGCQLPEIKKRNPDTLLELFFCSHWRSYQFYAESLINENGFQSISCNSWQEFVTGKCNPYQEPINMGYSVPNTARGNYYLGTNRESPFSLEGNPRTLAESRYSEQSNYYPVTTQETQFSIRENMKSTAESEYQDYGNMYYPAANSDPQLLLQEDLKTLKEDVYHTNNNNHYYPTSNSDAQLLQENLKNLKQNLYNANNDKYYYPTPNSAPQLLHKDLKNLKQHMYNTNNNNHYYPTANSDQQLLEEDFKTLKRNVHHDNHNYPTSSSETKSYFQDSPPKMLENRQYYY